MARTKSAYVKCSEELAERLRAEADARDLGERFLVDRALAEFLDKLIPVGEVSLTRPSENEKP